MARDMEKKAVTDRKSELKIYDRLPLKVRKDSGIRDGLEYAAQATGMSMTPVSYTHLDVYKRQVLQSFPTGLHCRLSFAD